MARMVPGKQPSPGEMLYRIRFKNPEFGDRMTTIFLAVDKDSIVHHAPRMFTQFDGIAFRRVKKMVKAIDPKAEISVSNVRVELH